MNKNLRIFTLLFTLLYFFSSTVLPALAAITYTYDANGNMSSDGTECFEYNEANQLKKVKNCSNNQTIAEYVYDSNGNRVMKKVYSNGTLQKTVYSPSDDFETVKLASNGATQNTSYYMVNNEIVAKKNPDGTKHYYHNDHLGSTSVMTNQAGALVEKTEYDPWGEVKSGGTTSKFQYTGQEKDDETGLNYYNYRYYDSHIRRFTQPDDIIQNVYNPQDLNRYSYVRNNPLKYTDPSGHIPVLAVGFLGGVLGAGAGYAEVRLTNPDASFTDYAKAMGVGFVAGAAGSVVGLAAATFTATTLTSAGLSGGLTALSSNVVGGMAAGVIGGGTQNKFDNKSFFANAPQSLAWGGVTGGIGGSVARSLVPAGRGPAPKLDFSLTTKTGPNTLRYMQRVTLDTGMTSMWNIPANANRNKVNSNQGKSHKASNGIIKNILQFFGFKK